MAANAERLQISVNSLGEASEVALLQTLVHVNATSSATSKAKAAHAALVEQVEASKDISFKLKKEELDADKSTHKFVNRSSVTLLYTYNKRILSLYNYIFMRYKWRIFTKLYDCKGA